MKQSLSPEAVVAALDEAVRGEHGLQRAVSRLATEVARLQEFRSTVIGVVVAINVIAPVFWHYVLK